MKRAPALLIAALLATLAAFGLGDDALDRYEFELADQRFERRGEQPTDDIVFVAIDQPTLNRLGQFPFDRRLHARLVRRLTAAKVRAIAYDVQFTEQTTEAQDGALYDALAAAPRVVLGTGEAEDGEHNVFGGEETVRAMGARVGNVQVRNDSDGVVRRFARTVDGIDSFAVAVGKEVGVRVPDDFDGRALIDWIGEADTVTRYSFHSVLSGRVGADRLRGRIVVVGANASGLEDFHSTPWSEARMPGPELLANEIQTVLSGVPIRPASNWLDLVFTLLAALAPALVALRRGPLVVLASGLVTAGAVLVGGYAVFDWADRMVELAQPLAALLLSLLGALGVSAVFTAIERERTRSLFARFVPEAVVDDVLAKADGTRLGGVRVEVSILFCDLRGSTLLMESLPPEEGLAILNGYLTEMADAVLAHGGTLVGYRGDGLMAVFGAPLELPDHAERALAAGAEMVGERLGRCNAALPDGRQLRMGVGIATGEVMAGNIGSEQRMEYTAIGDTANVAARLESMTKEVGRPVLVAASTYAQLGEAARASLESVGELDVKGRVGSVEAFGSAVG